LDNLPDVEKQEVLNMLYERYFAGGAGEDRWRRGGRDREPPDLGVRGSKGPTGNENENGALDRALDGLAGRLSERLRPGYAADSAEVDAFFRRYPGARNVRPSVWGR
jgi:hypothetical protein